MSPLYIQYKYFLRIVRQLGLTGALRVRALTWLNRKLGENWVVRLQPDCVQHPLFIRPGTTDADVYFQVLIEKQYDIVTYSDPRIIVDCGANVGYTSAYFLSRFPAAHVIAIEPLAENAALCRRNLAPYGDRVKVIEAAIWSSSKKLKLDFSRGNEWGAQVRSSDRDETGDVAAIDIPSLNLHAIDILKIDIEGSEAELFSKGVEKWLPSVNSIVIELHGPECDKAFFSALSGYDYEWRQQGELSLVSKLRPINI